MTKHCWLTAADYDFKSSKLHKIISFVKNEVETTVRFIEQQHVHQCSDKFFFLSRINPASCSSRFWRCRPIISSFTGRCWNLTPPARRYCRAWYLPLRPYVCLSVTPVSYVETVKYAIKYFLSPNSFLINILVKFWWSHLNGSVKYR